MLTPKEVLYILLTKERFMMQIYEPKQTYQRQVDWRLSSPGAGELQSGQTQSVVRSCIS